MLTQIADDLHAWFGTSHGSGSPNAAVIADEDGLTVVDALLSPVQAAPFAAACEGLGLPAKRLVATSSHVEFVGGSTQFPLAAVYGTRQISAHLDQPPNIEGCQRLFPDFAADFVDLETRKVTHTVGEAAWISSRAVAVPLGGELRENLVVQVPEQGVVLCGALGSFGVTPLLFDGDPAAWIESLETILGYGTTFVPGHGDAGTEPDVRALQAYLQACIDAAGDATRIGPGPWDGWAARHFDAINVERAVMLARGDDSPPPSMLALLGAR